MLPLALENWDSSTGAGAMPKFVHICPVRSGHDLPAKIRVLRILMVVVEETWRRDTKFDKFWRG
jgi:hypothetical protein